jgi:hypothetical protein
MQIGFHRAPEDQEPRRGLGFGQDDSRSYEERQRIPGDYDAQVSIHGGIARHGLEHLASTDRGVTMMRNMIRRGIRAVQNGDPENASNRNGTIIATFAHDRVVPGIEPAATPEKDRQLLREVARNVVDEMVRTARQEAA